MDTEVVIPWFGHYFELASKLGDLGVLVMTSLPGVINSDA